MHRFHRVSEGTQAHIFQLSILALVPTSVVFLLTANWQKPWLVARLLAIPTLVVGVAFTLLYYFEHVIY